MSISICKQMTYSQKSIVNALRLPFRSSVFCHCFIPITHLKKVVPNNVLQDDRIVLVFQAGLA